MTQTGSKIENAFLLINTPGEAVDPDFAAAASQFFNEDSALAMLQRADLPPELIRKISKNSVSSKSRKVKLAIIQHPKTPRYIALVVMRHLFTFDLLRLALTPAVAGDLKMAAEEMLINKLETMSAGEKLSLARRASGRVAGALLLDKAPRIIAAALENPRLTEASVAKAVLDGDVSPALVRAVCTHARWSLRRDIRIALLRSEHTPLVHAMEFAKSLPGGVVMEIFQDSSLPENIKTCVMRNCDP